MPILQVIILALVQGITEFLPISSTAHLALAPWLLGWKDPGLTFDIALHLGSGAKSIAAITLPDSLIIGAAQALAIVPGTSRSGVTIATGLFRNIDRPAAARFSFLLSTPAIAGAAASALHHLMKEGGIPPDMRTPFALGILISGASGCAVIAFFLKYLQRHTLRWFILYRLIFGIMVI